MYVCGCAPYAHVCVFTSTALEHLTHPPLSVSNTKFASNISNTVNACVGPIWHIRYHTGNVILMMNVYQQFSNSRTLLLYHIRLMAIFIKTCCTVPVLHVSGLYS